MIWNWLQLKRNDLGMVTIEDKLFGIGYNWRGFTWNWLKLKRNDMELATKEGE